jgi:hypothetical protein
MEGCLGGDVSPCRSFQVPCLFAGSVSASLGFHTANVETLHEDDDSPAMAPEWDDFVSHATEDKDDVVRPLISELETSDLRVWYDEVELRVGASLQRKIDTGLASSRFGVVVS